MWTLPGNEFSARAEVYFWVNSNGAVDIVDYSKGSVLPQTDAPVSASSPAPGAALSPGPIVPADSSNTLPPGSGPMAGANASPNNDGVLVADPEGGSGNTILDIPVARTSPLEP